MPKFLSQSIVTNCLVFAASYAVCAEETYTQHKNVVYGEVHGIGLVMDIFTPIGNKNGLGVIDIASGAMHSDRGKINDHKKGGFFDVMCGQGYTVYALRPGSATKFSASDMLDNIGKGIAWIINHSKEYNIDPDRLGLMGASAGGYLACMTAVTAKEDSPATHIKAVGVFFPATDLMRIGPIKIDVRSDGMFAKTVRQLLFPEGLGDLDDEAIESRITQYSPTQLVTSKSPPFLFIHGDADIMVPLQQSKVMVEALKNADVHAELIVKKEGGHPWPSISEEVQVMADWFDKTLSTVAVQVDSDSALKSGK